MSDVFFYFFSFPFKVNVPYFVWSTSYVRLQEEMQCVWVNACGVKMDS